MNTIEKIHLYGFRDADYLWDIVEKNSSIQNYRNPDSIDYALFYQILIYFAMLPVPIMMT
jgi:hypothetical protein